MIDPDGLLRHAEQLAQTGRGRPTDAALRRGISTAYYAVFHDLTGQAASHLVGVHVLRVKNHLGLRDVRIGLEDFNVILDALRAEVRSRMREALELEDGGTVRYAARR